MTLLRKKARDYYILISQSIPPSQSGLLQLPGPKTLDREDEVST